MGCGASHVPDKPIAKRMVLSHDGVKTITRQGSMAPVLAAGPGEELPAREPMTSPIEQPGVELAPEPQPRLEPEPEVVPELEPEPEQEPQPQPQPELDIVQQAGRVLASEPSTPSTSSVHRPALVYAGAASVGGSFLAPLPSFGAGSADDDGARRSPGIHPASLAHVRRHSDGWQPALAGLWADGADPLSAAAAASSRSRLHRGPRRPPSAVRPVKHFRFPSQSLALS